MPRTVIAAAVVLNVAAAALFAASALMWFGLV
jgi:hypothetical protein